VWNGDHTGPYRARGPIKHPSGNLQPAAGARTAQAAPENITLGLADYLMDGNGKPEPGVPGIKDLTGQDSVGVLKPCCTTNTGPIRRSDTARPGNSAVKPYRPLPDRFIGGIYSGPPERMKLKLVGPLRVLFKDK
jgi:hypothetical protein